MDADSDFEEIILDKYDVLTFKYGKRFEISRIKDGVLIYCENVQRDAAEEKKYLKGDRNIYLQIAAIFRECNIIAWDGYNAFYPFILDGWRYSLKCDLSSGRTVEDWRQ